MTTKKPLLCLFAISVTITLTVEARAQLATTFGDTSSVAVKLGETETIAVYERTGESPLPIAELRKHLDEITHYVGDRIGIRTDTSFSIVFDAPRDGSCAARAITDFNGGKLTIIVFGGPSKNVDELLGILAHEIGHVLTLAFGVRVSAVGPGLTEGIATWAAGRYWYAWHGMRSFDDRARQVLLSKRRRLDDRESFGDDASDCFQQRVNFYTAWASFVGYLVRSKDKTTFLQLLVSVPSPPQYLSKEDLVSRYNEIDQAGPAYEQFYGLNFFDLESRWLDALGMQQ